MAERWHPQPVMHTPDDDRCFVAEHRRAFRHTREACFQLLKRLQREGPDPYAVVIPVPVLPRVPRRNAERVPPGATLVQAIVSAIEELIQRQWANGGLLGAIPSL